MEISKKEFLKLPQVPGVYTFWKEGKPIYIGKSINLKSRLNSYLLPNLGIKTSQMVLEAEEVTYIKVTSELEALLLESSLIKKNQPKYNIISKDDKHDLYIGITAEEFPRILTLRKENQIKLKAIFGPFPSSYNVKSILKLIRRIFPYSDHVISKKPCFYNHLGLCNPCPNIISSLKDDQRNILKHRYLDNIRNIKLILSRRFSSLRNILEKEMNFLASEQRYEEAKDIRDKIRALDYITQEKTSEEKFIENPNLIEDIYDLQLSELKKITGINNLERIECFDVAHLSGSAATASMVVMLAGSLENSQYRHFKIRQEKKQSDYDSMKEIALRRFNNLKRWGRPDLIIVDGGSGQVKIFNDRFSESEIPVLGIAKHPDRLVFPDGRKIKLTNKALEIVSRIRDEAHRFARRLHHKNLSALLTEK